MTSQRNWAWTWPLVSNFFKYVSSVLGEKQIESITTRIEELQRQRDQEQGGKLEQLEKELKEKEKDTIKVESNLKNVKDSKKQEEKKKQQIIKVCTLRQKVFWKTEKLGEMDLVFINTVAINELLRLKNAGAQISIFFT